MEICTLEFLEMTAIYALLHTRLAVIRCGNTSVGDCPTFRIRSDRNDRDALAFADRGSGDAARLGMLPRINSNAQRVEGRTMRCFGISQTELIQRCDR